LISARAKGIAWMIAVVSTAITLPLRFEIDATSFNVRISVTSIIIMLVTYTAWIKAKVDRLQESASLDSDDEEFLFFATSELQNQIWTLMAIYFVTFLFILILMVIGPDGNAGAAVAVVTYGLFTLSVLLVPALHNIDLAAGREVHARKNARHLTKERQRQREIIDAPDDLPEDVAMKLRKHNELINGDT
jgi:hypothetical protein